MILVAEHGWSYYAFVPACGLLCFGVGFVTGLPASRIQGSYPAVVTLASRLLPRPVSAVLSTLRGR
jgi:ABC-type branched-subunit amino acid transport system permease subunit